VVQAEEFSNNIEQTIFINEIMFNPEGNDYGNWQESEWIELFNHSDQAIDLTNWVLEDEANHLIEITNQNSDNNQNFADQGETVILPHSFLVIYVNGAPIFNNSGDVVYLQNSDGNLVDQHQYENFTNQGKTTGRSRNDLDLWLDNLEQTPNSANAQ
ncbi:MAG: lamin tail domain-containing protein, partial [Patescibacteria group bacterium]|nr:lamin tail domain-containing protein [Patescibacteria group bacterium]